MQSIEAILEKIEMLENLAKNKSDVAKNAVGMTIDALKWVIGVK